MNKKPFFHRNYSLHKSRQILVWGNECYQNHYHTISKEELPNFEENLQRLDEAMMNSDRDTADTYARKVEKYTKRKFKKPIAKGILELFLALAVALTAATVIRQMWFETYEIPTGSMRPTYREQDHLIVTKSPFGINLPFINKHIYMDPSLIKRGNPIIWSGEGVDLPDTSTKYFWLFPYTKRYIKRLIGKPGDTLYFYGGKIYGIDKEGAPITELLDNPYMDKLDHIPFTSFTGRAASETPGQIHLKHMNMPIGRLIIKRDRSLRGEIYDGDSWVKDRPEAAKKPHNEIDTFGDFWGMNHYAMARLLTKKQVKELTNTDPNTLKDAPLYLELRHNPNLTNPGPKLLVGTRGEVSLLFQAMTSVIPLDQEKIDSLMNHMYTARFIVKNEEGTRYNSTGNVFSPESPNMNGIPDGRYEFYYGKGSYVGWGGILWDLPENHSLLKTTPENVQRLFNTGIEWYAPFAPSRKDQTLFPARFAYFRDGDLYVMGAPLLKKENPALQSFLKREKEREKKENNYVAFIDRGAPLKEDGTLDLDFIHTFGLKIPEGHYFVLGDNHAMSADSRYFGFVPEDNLEGVPSFNFWPPGSNFGFPSQASYPWITFSNLVIWGLALVIGGGLWLFFRHKHKQPVFKKK